MSLALVLFMTISPCVTSGIPLLYPTLRILDTNILFQSTNSFKVFRLAANGSLKTLKMRLFYFGKLEAAHVELVKKANGEICG